MSNQKNTVKEKKIKVYFDGCCEPKNPGGTASYGIVIFKDNKKILKVSKIFEPVKGKEKQTSNNVAEYSGFKRALEWLLSKSLNNEEILIFSDSKLVICQMFGDIELGGRKWKIRSGYYKPIALQSREILNKFSNIKGQWIPREENSIADELSKAELIRKGIEFKIQPKIAY